MGHRLDDPWRPGRRRHRRAAAARRRAHSPATRSSRSGTITPRPDDRVVDATGLVLAPGVIDAHNHSTDGLDADPDAITQISQGITTLAVGQDGSSPFPLRDYLAKRRASPVDGERGGAGRPRDDSPAGDGRRISAGPATPAEIARLEALVDQEMRSGAHRPVVGPRVRSRQLRVDRRSRGDGARRREARRVLHLAHPRRSRQVDGRDPRSDRDRREGEAPGADHAPQARHRRRVGQGRRSGRDDRCGAQARRRRDGGRLSRISRGRRTSRCWSPTSSGPTRPA